MTGLKKYRRRDEFVKKKFVSSPLSKKGNWKEEKPKSGETRK